mmetsp:Transcript_9095/g.19790  ORF Transcript_9095/g.19790 Transcript_9095/m.19790 type:complete len:296 (-) Transcript_9095:474-1361(-)
MPAASRTFCAQGTTDTSTSSSSTSVPPTSASAVAPAAVSALKRFSPAANFALPALAEEKAQTECASVRTATRTPMSGPTSACAFNARISFRTSAPAPKSASTSTTNTAGIAHCLRSSIVNSFKLAGGGEPAGHTRSCTSLAICSPASPAEQKMQRGVATAEEPPVGVAIFACEIAPTVRRASTATLALSVTTCGVTRGQRCAISAYKDRKCESANAEKAFPFGSAPNLSSSACISLGGDHCSARAARFIAAHPPKALNGTSIGWTGTVFATPARRMSPSYCTKWLTSKIGPHTII